MDHYMQGTAGNRCIPLTTDDEDVPIEIQPSGKNNIL